MFEKFLVPFDFELFLLQPISFATVSINFLYSNFLIYISFGNKQIVVFFVFIIIIEHLLFGFTFKTFMELQTLKKCT